MKLADLIKTARGRLDDQAAPFLWSDPELTGYINEAENEAAERARLLHDETSAMTRVDVVAGTAQYKLDGKVVGLDRVVLDSTGLPLARTTREEMDDCMPGWESHEGTPRFFIEREGYLRLVPKPMAADTLSLALWRLPLEPLEGTDDEPEIAERHHARMLDWAYHLAYLKRDADTFDEQKAASFAARFTDSFGIRPDANVQRKQRLHRAPTVKPQW